MASCQKMICLYFYAFNFNPKNPEDLNEQTKKTQFDFKFNYSHIVKCLLFN